MKHDHPPDAEACRLLQRARRELGSASGRERRKHAEALLHIANRAVEVGELELAQRVSDETERPAKDKALHLLLRADALARLGREDDAMHALERAMDSAVSRGPAAGLYVLTLMARRLTAEGRGDWAMMCAQRGERELDGIIEAQEDECDPRDLDDTPDSELSLLEQLASLQVESRQFDRAQQTLSRMLGVQESELTSLDSRDYAVVRSVCILAACGRYDEAEALLARLTSGQPRAGLRAIVCLARFRAGDRNGAQKQLALIDADVAESSRTLWQRFIADSPLRFPDRKRGSKQRGESRLFLCDVASVQHALGAHEAARLTLRIASQLSASLQPRWIRERFVLLGQVALEQAAIGDRHGVLETAGRVIPCVRDVPSNRSIDFSSGLVGVFRALVRVGEPSALMELIDHPVLATYTERQLEASICALIAEDVPELAARLISDVARSHRVGRELLEFAKRHRDRSTDAVGTSQAERLNALLAVRVQRNTWVGPELIENCRQIVLGPRSLAARSVLEDLITDQNPADACAQLVALVGMLDDKSGNAVQARLMSLAIALLDVEGSETRRAAGLVELLAVAIAAKDVASLESLCQRLSADSSSSDRPPESAFNARSGQHVELPPTAFRARTARDHSLVHRARAIVLACSGDFEQALRLVPSDDEDKAWRAARWCIAGIAAERGHHDVVASVVERNHPTVYEAGVVARLATRLLRAGAQAHARELLARSRLLIDDETARRRPSVLFEVAAAHARCGERDTAAELVLNASSTLEPIAQTNAEQELPLTAADKIELLQRCLKGDPLGALADAVAMAPAREWSSAWAVLEPHVVDIPRYEDAMPILATLPADDRLDAMLDVAERLDACGIPPGVDAMNAITREAAADPDPDYDDEYWTRIATLLFAAGQRRRAFQIARAGISHRYRAVGALLKIARRAAASGDTRWMNKALHEAQRRARILLAPSPFRRVYDTVRRNVLAIWHRDLLYGLGDVSGPYATVDVGDTLWDLGFTHQAQSAYAAAIDGYVESCPWRDDDVETVYRHDTSNRNRVRDAAIKAIVALRLRMGEIGRAEALAGTLGSDTERARTLADVALAASELRNGRQFRLDAIP